MIRAEVQTDQSAAMSFADVLAAEQPETEPVETNCKFNQPEVAAPAHMPAITWFTQPEPLPDTPEISNEPLEDEQVAPAETKEMFQAEPAEEAEDERNTDEDEPIMPTLFVTEQPPPVTEVLPLPRFVLPTTERMEQPEITITAPRPRVEADLPTPTRTEKVTEPDVTVAPQVNPRPMSRQNLVASRPLDIEPAPLVQGTRFPDPREVATSPPKPAQSPLASEVPPSTPAEPLVLTRQPVPPASNDVPSRAELHIPKEQREIPHDLPRTAAEPAPQVVVAGRIEPAASAEPARRIEQPMQIEQPRPLRATEWESEAPRMPVRNLTVTVEPTSGTERTDIRFVHRNGTLDFAIRSANPDTARTLRSEIPELVRNLEQQGYKSDLDYGPDDRSDRHPRRPYYERNDDDD